MRISTWLMASFAIPALAISVPVNAKYTNSGFDASRHILQASTKSDIFASRRSVRIDGINAAMKNDIPAAMLQGDENYLPSTLGPASIIGDLDTPDGVIWHYTGTLTIKEIQHSPYYTEKKIVEYRFEIFDENMKPIGTIHDKMRYEANELRVPLTGCDLAPIVTRNFFNNDDKYEIMVGLAVNTTTVGKNNYRTIVYSLGGEKESLEVEDTASDGKVTKEFDKPVYVVNSSLGDVLDASTPGNEELYMTFYDEKLPASAPEGTDPKDVFWTNLVAANMHFSVYGKTKDGKDINKLLEKKIGLVNLQGDQQYTPLMFSFTRDGKPYILFPYYREPFYNRYDDPQTEECTQRQPNNLAIELYQFKNGEPELVQTTDIPVVKHENEVTNSFYSVGNLRYRDDVIIGADGKASFMITRSDNTPPSDSYISSFSIYDHEGKITKNIFSGAQNTLDMTDISGQDPMQMFVVQNSNGSYTFNMVNLNTGEVCAKINNMLDYGDGSDSESVTANIDRVPKGDSYMFAAEMSNPVLNDNDDTMLRVAWFDAQGRFEDMHRVNLGQNVQYAKTLIDGNALRPDLFNSDPHQEYMVLIKHAVGGTAINEEFLLAQAENPDAPDGKPLLHLTPCEKGKIASIMAYPEAKIPTLNVIYSDGSQYTQDIYFLPLDGSSVSEIETAGKNSAIAYNGIALHAPGELIKVYSLQGHILAEGYDTVDTGSLDSGIYVAVAGDKICKFAK